MKDHFKREINYLRISVTDKCNLRCVYCMPKDGVELLEHQDILSIEDILRVVRTGVQLGIRKIRLTGGEPLVRKGIVDLISQISAIPEIDDLALTTNGILLPAMAKDLKKAGLKRINISLDTLIPERFASVTRNGKFEDAWAGINAALTHGFKPIKLNTVAMRGFNDDELVDLARLTLKLPLHLRFIEVMPIGETEEWSTEKHIPTAEILELLKTNLGVLKPAGKVIGSGPASYYKIPGAKGTIGFIGAISNHFCANCNRLRLTCEGKLRPCLHSPIEVDMGEALRRKASDKELVRIFQEVIQRKPEQHNMAEEGWGENSRFMSQIGG